MNYKPSKLLFNAHLETIFPALLRRVKFAPYQRERISTPDDDFLDLDWAKQGSSKLVIISHGLEGNSSKPYIRGMAKAFHSNGYDILAWNFRGCSGEINKKLRFYHSGATDDLQTVIDHAKTLGYNEIYLIGFSLGGNVTLKYLGEQSSKVSSLIKKAVAISVPLNLHSSCLKISEPDNAIYSNRFLRNLKKKVRKKSALMPDKISTTGLNKIKTLTDFDDTYTAPIHGFKNAIDYYTMCSSLYFLNDIKVPSLVLNALNDPFLAPDCHPVEEYKEHKFVTVEAPYHGGHVGFSQPSKHKLYWSEIRALSFIQDSASQ